MTKQPDQGDSSSRPHEPAEADPELQNVLMALIRPHSAVEFGFRKLALDGVWAYALICSKITNDAEAVFHRVHGAWSLVVLGTDIDEFAIAYGVEPDALARWRRSATTS